MIVDGGTPVLVTGASSGIGRETAFAFAHRKAPLFLVARRAELLGRVAEECRRLGSSRILARAADLSVPGVGARIVQEAEEALGRLDVLVANAGYGNSSPVRDYVPEQMARMWQVNFQSGYESIHAALPGMLARRRGHLFLVASVVGRRAIPYAGAYCATKFAQVALGEALHFELAGTGVLSTVICPGSTDTPFFDAVERAPSGPPPRVRDRMQSPAVVAEAIVRTVGKRRREIAFTLPAKTALLVNRLAPWLLDIAVRIHLKRRLAKAR